MNTKKQYDLICSLGANCSVGNQLRLRDLRKIALPFDWTWFNCNEAIYKLAEGFENNFANFMKKENLIKLQEEETSSWHYDRYQYQDKYTNFYYFNHFYKTENEEEEINRVLNKFRNRCNKLHYFLNNADEVLLIMSIICDIETEAIQYLLNTIQKIYPNTTINIIFQAFDCKNNEHIKLQNLEIKKYERKENIYDYLKTNWEWQFLDNIELSSKFYELQPDERNSENIIKENWLHKLIEFKKFKKGILINLFKNTNTCFYFKSYILGARIQVVFGKNKIE